MTVWSYRPEAAESLGAAVRDAAEIVPLADGALSNLAYLSSLFRYRVLERMGGIWSDMDVVALAPEALAAAGPFIASERRRPFRHGEPTATGQNLTQVTNCFMASPSPGAGDLWQRADEAVAGLAPDARDWRSVGPHLLGRLMLENPGHGVGILPPDAAVPVAWWNVPAYFLEDRDPPPSPFMHMFATIWARRGVDAEAAFPQGSVAGRLWRRFGL